MFANNFLSSLMIFIVKSNKIQLVSIIYILIINVCQDNVKHGKQLCRKTVHFVKFIGKGCSIFVSSAYITLLSTKDIKYCMLPTYLAVQQQNKLIQFPVCANVKVLFSLDILPQVSEKHIQT